EIHFVFSGELSYEIDGETIILHQNEALLIPPNVVHRLACCESDYLKNSLAFTVESKDFPHIISALNTVRKFRFSDETVDSVDFILKQRAANDIFTQTLITGRTFEIIYSALKALGVSLPENYKASGDSRLLAAKHYIENNRSRLISCEDVAKECCLSRKHLNRIFKKYTGQTLNDYLISSRAQYAKQLVVNSEYTVKEISYMMGFENASSFVAFFKRHFGLPPKLYRLENHQKREESPSLTKV
ncbi:MAG: AraC family transcriptional regulator, partial [Clostridia bacterium]|nr:AraC family transcriptional regulator [Clostridia bacterium]